MQEMIPEQLLLLLLRHTLGSSVELDNWTIGNRKHDYSVLIVQLLHPAMRVVVKLAGPEAPLHCPFDRTAMFHRLVLSETSIRMPDVIAADVSYRAFPWRYFIKEYVPGEEWMQARECMDADERSNAFRQIGDAVAQLHAVRFPAFGEVAVDGSVEDAGNLAQALAARARQFIRSGPSLDLFLSVLDSRGDLFRSVARPGLCHEDLHGHNILFRHDEDGWNLATILDFDKAWAGHPESDLARLEIWRGMTSPEFWQAYQATICVEPLYAQRRPVYQLLWCLEYAQPTEQHLADTRRVCAELGIEGMERF